MNRVLDLLCYTALAPLIRKWRTEKLYKRTAEKRMQRKISVLLATIMAAHGDMLS